VKKNVNLQKHGLVVLVAVGAIAVVAIGWLTLLGPKQKQIADLKNQTAAVRQQITDDVARAATARSATSTPQIKTADIYRLETAMPSTLDMPDLLLEIDQTAKAAGVSLQSIAPSDLLDTGSGYSYDHIQLTANGNFYTITDLLYRLRNMVYVRGGTLESNGRIFTVDQVAISPSGDALAANITLDTYVYGSLPSAAASPALPGVTSTTDTTATTTTTTPPPSASGPSAAGATP
jgi:Tfp pilus assembly protein PilO